LIINPGVLAGGHGIVFDGPVDKDFIALVEKFWAKGKIVSSVCHGPAGLVAVKAPDGTPIVKGKKVRFYVHL
jgi:putative intracellular protease/amidase